jgi:hypothetical protein
MDEVVERMYLVRKIYRGLSDLEAGRVVSQAEVECIDPALDDAKLEVD